MNVCDILFFDLHFSQSDTVQKCVKYIGNYWSVNRAGTLLASQCPLSEFLDPLLAIMPSN